MKQVILWTTVGTLLGWTILLWIANWTVVPMLEETSDNIIGIADTSCNIGGHLSLNVMGEMRILNPNWVDVEAFDKRMEQKCEEFISSMDFENE